MVVGVHLLSGQLSDLGRGLLAGGVATHRVPPSLPSPSVQELSKLYDSISTQGTLSIGPSHKHRRKSPAPVVAELGGAVTAAHLVTLRAAGRQVFIGGGLSYISHGNSCGVEGATAVVVVDPH